MSTSFITISPTTGTGGATLSISGSAYTGRNSRSASFSLNGTAGDDTPVPSANSLVVTQSGAAEFISLSTTSSTSSFPAAGGDITFSGTSNLEKIKLAFGNDASSSDFTSASINNGTAITTVSSFTSGDGYTSNLGTDAAYSVSFTFHIPTNTDSSDGKTYKYKFTVGSSTYDVTVNQSAASAYTLAFSSSTATVNADGTLTSPSSVSVSADSGLTWAITPQ